VERWTSPDEMAEMELAELTSHAFAQWAAVVLAAADVRLRWPATPLSARGRVERAIRFCT